MEHTILERSNSTRSSLHSYISFGRISKIYSDTRLCEVKTFLGRGPMDDNHIPHCQWINGDAHPDGDESGTIPRVGAYGLVFYIDGEPFIFGFWKPLDTSGSASIGGALEDLNTGDRILKTVGGNKIILRAHGEIQVQSTDTCRTIYFPDSNIINTLCRNFEFRTDGGTIDWLNLNDNDDTYYKQEYRDNISRANVIIEERGTVDGGFISRTTIGVGSDTGIDAPVFSLTTKTDGTTELNIQAPDADNGHHTTIAPDGTTTVEVAGVTKFSITSDGTVTVDVGPGKATLTLDPSGKATLTTNDDIDVTSSGNINLTGSKITLNGAGGEILTTETSPVIDEVFGSPSVGVSSVSAG